MDDIKLNEHGLTGLVTLDGHRPSYQPDARWCWWSYDEIYLGKEGLKKYIPKVDDYVIIPQTGEAFVVMGLDPITFVPNLRPITIRQTIIKDEISSTTEQNYRLYYDTSQKPYTLTPDAFLYSYSSEATVARIYKGLIIDDNNVISRVYNNSGDFVGHDIPLVKVAFNSHDNYSIKSIPSCNTNVELKDGEACTIVIFNSEGKVITRTHCLVENTTYIPQAYAEQRYITNIYLKSVFIDSADPTTINFPVNLTIDSLNPIGVVVYNDGTEQEYIVDGGKFDIYGLNVLEDNTHLGPLVNSFASTTIGHKVPLVLAYNMDPGERTVMATGYAPNVIPRKYELIVSEPNRSYGVKLFAYPKWVDELSGYELNFYLLNLDRDLIYPVTSLVRLAKNSRPFAPKAYGITQVLTYNIDLGQISSSFKTFNHSQTIEVILRAKGTDDAVENIWEVATEYPSSVPFFGSGLKAQYKKNGSFINLGNKMDNVSDWLEKVYITTSPLVNRTVETKPITPTHIGVNYNGESKVIPIADFNKDIEFKKPVKLYNNIEIIFYKETIGNFLTLSVCNLPIRK